MDQTYGKTISIDAVPEIIDVHEKYTYQITVSESADTKIQSSWGEVRVEVPYDGYETFQPGIGPTGCKVDWQRTIHSRAYGVDGCKQSTGLGK